MERRHQCTQNKTRLLASCFCTALLNVSPLLPSCFLTNWFKEYGNQCNKCEEHLQILKDSEATYSISSSSSLHHKLDYDKLLQLPIKQQALARECSDNCILEGSLRLLDICSTTKE
ncbi:hypothetical protein ACSQ67_026001 [Phaseolus vulgaris]